MRYTVIVAFTIDEPDEASAEEEVESSLCDMVNLSSSNIDTWAVVDIEELEEEEIE